MASAYFLRFLALGLIAGGASATRVKQSSRAHAHASAARSGESEKDDVNAFTVFSRILKDLEAEAQEGDQMAASMDQWCRDTESNKVAMVQVIQRQLDEAAIVVQQVSSDEKRLRSEINLVLSTEREREQQMQDAQSTSQFASSEFANEEDQVAKTLEAAQKALKLVEAQVHNHHSRQEEKAPVAESEDSELTSNLQQISPDSMTDAEKTIMSAYTKDKPAAIAQMPSATPELLKTLQDLVSRLEKERDTSDNEHQAMSTKIWAFSDHLNASILETKSQAAALNMEMAQRKREHTRLNGKIADLKALLKSVKAGKSATENVCLEDKKHRKDNADRVKHEANEARKQLEHLSLESPDVVLEVPKGSLSFLQVRNAKSGAPGASSNPMADIADFASDDSDTDSDSDSSSSEAEDAPAAESESQSETATAVHVAPSVHKAAEPGDAEVRHLKAMYAGLLNRMDAAETSVADRQKWCDRIRRDANSDKAAMDRSLKRMDAKLGLVKAAIDDYEKSSKYDTEQHKIIDSELTRLSKMTNDAESKRSATYNALGARAKELMSLAAQLSAEEAPEEKRTVEAAKSLLQQVESHQNGLHVQSDLFNERHEAIEKTFKAVQQALSADVKHNARRLLRFKAESQFLASLAHAKTTDQSLSDRYEEISESVCSQDGMKQIKTEEDQLEEEASALRKSIATEVSA